MNIPAIAKATFENLRNQPEFFSIFESVSKHLNRIKNSKERARFVHNIIEEYNKETFSHPLIQQFMPCKAGCTACCHTQVSVTSDEANLLAERVEQGIDIDFARLNLQASTGNDTEAYFKLSYSDRKCVFLNENGECKVYNDRPSVCRTNAVLGSADQCDTSGEQKTLRLIKTSKADMAIVSAYANSVESGTLPYMLNKLVSDKTVKKSSNKGFFQKLISKEIRFM
jgi:Fe-S-cluster containining protein